MARILKRRKLDDGDDQNAHASKQPPSTNKKLSPTSKQPSLRPRTSNSNAGAKADGDDVKADSIRKTATGRVAKRRTKSLIPAIRRHVMRTRSMAETFPFFELPAEIRNLVYTFAFKQDSKIDLKKFIPPPSLYSCRQIFSEAPPFLFAANEFTGAVRSNWCVYGHHFHEPGHIHFFDTGMVSCSKPLVKTLSGPDSSTKLRHEDLRFAAVTLKVMCCCCDGAKNRIGRLLLEVKGNRPSAVCKVACRNPSPPTSAAFEIYAKEVEELAMQIGEREKFNGFTLDDIYAFGECFRYEEDV